MYRHCIYCSADLGANEALEAFPVGRTLAFDAARGRLWAVCGKCARWNLSPIEERWEAIEDAERAFRDTRLRAQSENVGLAKLRDGTRLIRVGAALQGELAAWRYGEQLVKRRQRHLILGGLATVGSIAAFLGIGYASIGFGTYWIGNTVLGSARKWYRESRPLHTLGPGDTAHGAPLQLKRKHLADAALHRAEAGGIELHLRDPRVSVTASRMLMPSLVLPDHTARRVLERGMVHLNARGAKRTDLDFALRRIASAGSAEEYILGTAASRLVLESEEEKRKMPETTALALEIALHEEQERRALAGELTVLEAAWRDAEPIADLADRLAIEGS